MKEPGFFKILWEVISTSPWERHKRLQERDWEELRKSLLRSHPGKIMRVSATSLATHSSAPSTEDDFRKMRQELAQAEQSRLMEAFAEAYSRSIS